MITIGCHIRRVNKTVPLSAFNEGKAGEIFAEVRRSSSTTVIDNDGNKLGVIMSLEDYKRKVREYNEVICEVLTEERNWFGL